MLAYSMHYCYRCFILKLLSIFSQNKSCPTSRATKLQHRSVKDRERHNRSIEQNKNKMPEPTTLKCKTSALFEDDTDSALPQDVAGKSVVFDVNKIVNKYFVTHFVNTLSTMLIQATEKPCCMCSKLYGYNNDTNHTYMECNVVVEDTKLSNQLKNLHAKLPGSILFAMLCQGNPTIGPYIDLCNDKNYDDNYPPSKRNNQLSPASTVVKIEIVPDSSPSSSTINTILPTIVPWTCNSRFKLSTACKPHFEDVYHKIWMLLRGLRGRMGNWVLWY